MYKKEYVQLHRFHMYKNLVKEKHLKYIES